jgi:DNA polymerase III delta prime subunit
MENVKQLWVDKYRPTTIDSYILNEDLKEYFKGMIANNALQNCTFLGVQGSGKTTLAKILCNEFNAEVLFVKCSTEGTVDILRTKVAEFCNALSFDGKIKIVVLDEIDSASSAGDNNFQKGLRTLIEAAQDDTRFILTANYNKIIPAILSRCPLIPLKYDKKDLLLYIKNILDNENIKYTKASLKEFIEEVFVFYPDCRRIINYLQFCCNSGELIVNLNSVINAGVNDFQTALIEKCKSEKNILNVRQYYLKNKDKIADYVTFASEIYSKILDDNLIIDNDGILKLTDIIYYLNTCVDKESLFFGFLAAIHKFMERN